MWMVYRQGLFFYNTGNNNNRPSREKRVFVRVNVHVHIHAQTCVSSPDHLTSHEKSGEFSGHLVHTKARL